MSPRLGKLVNCVLTTACVLLTGSALAHHSFGNYDLDTTQVLEGTVERYDWRNPHVRIAVRAADGTVWNIETDAPATLEETGWNRDSYAPGDPVTVRFHPSRAAGQTTGLLYTVRGPSWVSRGSVARTGMPATTVAQIILALSLTVATGITMTYRRHRNFGAIAVGICGAATLLWTLQFSFSLVGETIGLAMLLLGAVWAALSTAANNRGDVAQQSQMRATRPRRVRE